MTWSIHLKIYEKQVKRECEHCSSMIRRMVKMQSGNQSPIAKLNFGGVFQNWVIVCVYLIDNCYGYAYEMRTRMPDYS